MLICSSIFVFTLAGDAIAEIFVGDMIAQKAEKVMLKAETRGTFFSQGGKLVEFLIDGKSIGNALSGGDGFAFKQFTPLRAGIYHVIAKADKDVGNGVLLSLNKGAGIVVVEVEGSLFQAPFSNKPRSGSVKAISEISRRLPVVFLHSGSISINIIRTWLKENAFKELPVISWEQGEAFDEISKKGFKLKAVIGSAQVIESANKYHPLTFSFEESEDAAQVKNWEEIRRRLK